MQYYDKYYAWGYLGLNLISWWTSDAPKRNILGKNGSFWVPWGPRRDPYKANICGYHEFDQMVAVKTKSGTLRPSGGPKRVFWGWYRPFLPVFVRFLELGGSKWAITVLDEQGILLRWSRHPTSLSLKKIEFPKKLGLWNLGIGPK